MEPVYSYFLRMSFCLLSVVFASTGFLQAQPPNPSTPNIIYILVDDLGYGDVNFELPNMAEFSNPYVQTPHLAKLAKESLVFRHHSPINRASQSAW